MVYKYAHLFHSVVGGVGESLLDTSHCNTNSFFALVCLIKFLESRIYIVTSFAHRSLFTFRECDPVPKISPNFLWGLCASNTSQPLFSV